MTGGGEFDALAGAVARVRGWEAVAGDDTAELRERYEAQLRAEGAAEVLRAVRAALDPR